MSILNTLRAVKEEGFDPRTGKINTSGLLPAGEYPVRLLTTDSNVNPGNGREQVVLTLEVSSGEMKGRQERLFLVFDNDLPDFVVNMNAKILLSIAEFANITLTEAELANVDTTAQALKKGIGSQFLMELTVRPNKRNPEYPHRNYEFGELPQVDNSTINVGESEIPF